MSEEVGNWNGECYYRGSGRDLFQQCFHVWLFGRGMHPAVTASAIKELIVEVDVAIKGDCQ